MISFKEAILTLALIELKYIFYYNNAMYFVLINNIFFSLQVRYILYRRQNLLSSNLRNSLKVKKFC